MTSSLEYKSERRGKIEGMHVVDALFTWGHLFTICEECIWRELLIDQKQMEDNNPHLIPLPLHVCPAHRMEYVLRTE